MIEQKQGIVIWLNTLKHTKTLKRFGNIHYVSKRLKYIIIYCNTTEVESIIRKLKALPFVMRVEPSYKPFLKTEFENAKPDKAKEYDYKLGF